MSIPPLHICLVSDQPVPSLAPLLEPTSGVQRVILAVEPERKRQAEWLADALRNRGIETEIYSLRDGYNLSLLREDFSRLREHCPAGAAVNISGGSKLMSMAAYDAFTRPDDAIYYINIRSGAVDWLRPQGQASQALGVVMTLDDYLRSFGSVSQNVHPQDDIPPACMELARQLLKRTDLRNAAVQVRGLLSNLDDTLTTRDPLPVKPAMANLRRLLEQLHLITDAGAGRIRLLHPRVRRSLDGIWLEDAVYKTLKKLRSTDPAIQELARGLHLTRVTESDASIDNEIDVALLRNNVLHLIECKTGAMGMPKEGMRQVRNGMTLGEQAVHKLASLRARCGGMTGRVLLISQSPLRPSDMARARELQVEIFAHNQLKQLPELLSRWLQA